MSFKKLLIKKFLKSFGLAIVLGLLTNVSSLEAQTTQDVLGAGSDGLYITASTDVYLKGLILTPSQSLVVSNTNVIENTPPTAIASFTLLPKSFSFSTPIGGYIGTIGIRYTSTEVVGLLKEKFDFLEYDGTDWSSNTPTTHDQVDYVLSKDLASTTLRAFTLGYKDEGLPSLSLSTINVSKTSLIADGTDSSTITINIKDVNGLDIETASNVVLLTFTGDLTPSTTSLVYKGNGQYESVLSGGVLDGTVVVGFSFDGNRATQSVSIVIVEDLDDDNDGQLDADEITCGSDPLDASSMSLDTDADGIPDCVDTDKDGDGILDTSDNCPLTSNADQLDTDADGIGDLCDNDVDGDGYSDTDEIACGSDPLLVSSKPLDTDNDGIANCIDTDDDNDGFSDTDETTCGSDPLLASSKPLDTDSDGTPNCIDTDDDNDSYLDENDAFPLDETEWTDTDSDGIGNNADTDDDNDGQSDEEELFCGTEPLNASSMSLDTDLDGITDCYDLDNDNDGVNDTNDAFPLDPTEWADTDADGIGNNADTDDDGDGQSDYNELVCGSDPLDQYSKSLDIDSDNIPDCVDEDKDGDGYLNDNDAFPEDGSEWIDTDRDGLGDNFEVDKDNDGVLDINDAFPLDPNESKDSDGDGIGDNADPDDNNDGFGDDQIYVSGVLTPNSTGLESTWKIINIEKYPNARVSIYNKSGQEVFNKLGYKNDWRGTFNNGGEPLPAGSYYYMIDLNNGSKALTGWLYITY
jgi:gliding motility-associated-like protein